MKILLLLGAVLLIKQSLSQTENTTTSNELSTEEKSFCDAVIAKVVTLSDEPLKLTTKLYQDTYADKSNDEFVIKELKVYLGIFENTEQLSDSYKLRAFLTLYFVFDPVSGPLSDGAEIRLMYIPLKEAMKKHDVKSVSDEFQRKFNELLEWFTQELEARSVKLSSDEQLWVKALKEMFLEFKNESNYEKKENDMKAIFSKLAL